MTPDLVRLAELCRRIAEAPRAGVPSQGELAEIAAYVGREAKAGRSPGAFSVHALGNALAGLLANLRLVAELDEDVKKNGPQVAPPPQLGTALRFVEECAGRVVRLLEAS